MGITDQKPRTATEEDCRAPWNGGKNGKYFRCYLCGYKFVVGDYYRWVMCTDKGYTNFLVCGSCDSLGVVQKWINLNKEWESLREGKFWHFTIPNEDSYKDELREYSHEIRDLRADLKSINQTSRERY